MIEKYIDYIDDPNDTYEEYAKKAMNYQFRCIFARPETIILAKKLTQNSDIIIAGAIDFPLGVLTLEEKLEQFRIYAEAGFHEIDYVLNQYHIEKENFDEIYKEMRAIHDFCLAYDIKEKKIVEMCKLDEKAKLKICQIALEIQPAYLKTSTGKSFAGANLNDVKLMKKILGDKVKIKAAGGIKTYDQAKAFIEAGADLIGATAGIQIVEQERSLRKNYQ